jgi:hypothetical protein
MATGIFIFGTGLGVGLKDSSHTVIPSQILSRRAHHSHTSTTTSTIRTLHAWGTTTAYSAPSSIATSATTASIYGSPSIVNASGASSLRAYEASSSSAEYGSFSTTTQTGASAIDSKSASYVPSATAASGGVWQPAVDSTWQIVLSNTLTLSTTATSVTPDVDVFDIDLFDNQAETITTLHNLGKKVICYFSAGSYEPDRPDSGNFKAIDKGNELQGWPGEYWLDLNSKNVQNIMVARIQLAATKGCDGIDPDNIDGYVSRMTLPINPDI